MSDDEQNIGSAFTKIYDENIWGKGSGTGSAPENNIHYAAFLQEYMKRNRVGSIIDFGCGDWQFSRYVCWDNKKYIGVDVVESVVNENTKLFAKDNIEFRHLVTEEEVDSLPNVDLVVSKDVMQHLPVSVIVDRINRLKKKCKALLITNDVYPDAWLNVDIEPGGCRSLRLMDAPFNFQCHVIFSHAFISYGTFVEKECVLINGDLT